jgi:AcrR family transcriptional regulator
VTKSLTKAVVAVDATTRARLLAAARELVAEIGFSAVTTRAISERAGVNNALVHYYFGSKTALVVQAALSSLDEAVGEPVRMLREAPTVGAGVAEVLRWVGSLDVDEPGMRTLIELTIEAFRSPEVRPVVAAALDEGRGELAAALASRGDVDADVAVGLAAALTALFDGVVLHRLVDADLDVAPWAAAIEASLIPTRLSGRPGRRR